MAPNLGSEVTGYREFLRCDSFMGLPSLVYVYFISCSDFRLTFSFSFLRVLVIFLLLICLTSWVSFSLALCSVYFLLLFSLLFFLSSFFFCEH